MTSTPQTPAHMEFRRLTEAEQELAVALASSLAGLDDPGFEGWGLGTTGAAPLNCEAYGLLVQGGLAGVIWLTAHPQGIAEATALALPRKRWGMGLMGWMLQSAAAEMAKRDLKGLFINLPGGMESLGEKLEDAGFRGPQLADPGYPKGRWIKKI